MINNSAFLYKSLKYANNLRDMLFPGKAKPGRISHVPNYRKFQK